MKVFWGKLSHQSHIITSCILHETPSSSNALRSEIRIPLFCKSYNPFKIPMPDLKTEYFIQIFILLSDGESGKKCSHTALDKPRSLTAIFHINVFTFTAVVQSRNKLQTKVYTTTIRTSKTALFSVLYVPNGRSKETHTWLDRLVPSCERLSACHLDRK